MEKIEEIPPQEVPRFHVWQRAVLQLDEVIQRLELKAIQERLLLIPESTSEQREFVRQLDIQVARLRVQRAALGNWARKPATWFDRLVVRLYLWAVKRD